MGKGLEKMPQNTVAKKRMALNAAIAEERTGEIQTHSRTYMFEEP